MQRPQHVGGMRPTVVGVVGVPLLDAHEEPGQLGLVQVELGDEVRPLEEEEGKAGEWTSAAGLLQLEGIKLPLVDLLQSSPELFHTPIRLIQEVAGR